MMRRFGGLLMLVLLTSMICSTFAFAEIPDISGLTNEELIQLKAEIMNQELERRLTKEYEILPGRYTVGEDIPARNYTFSYIDTSTNLTVWGAEYGDYRTNGGLLLNIVVKGSNPTIAKVVLEDGNVIDFNAALAFSIYTGIQFD